MRPIIGLRGSDWLLFIHFSKRLSLTDIKRIRAVLLNFVELKWSGRGSIHSIVSKLLQRTIDCLVGMDARLDISSNNIYRSCVPALCHKKTEAHIPEFDLFSFPYLEFGIWRICFIFVDWIFHFKQVILKFLFFIGFGDPTICANYWGISHNATETNRQSNGCDFRTGKSTIYQMFIRRKCLSSVLL